MIGVRILGLSPICTYGLEQFLKTQSGIEVLSGQGESTSDRSVAVVGCSPYPGDSVELPIPAPESATLIIADPADPCTADQYVHAGALGFVYSNAPLTTILDGIQHVAYGQRFVAAATAEELSADGLPLGLSRREYEVLKYIAQGRTHDQTARLLGISRHTVDTYIKRVRRKLGLGNKAQLARAAMLV
ncbi:response regulator transcription factor [Nonomuraea sp. MG754425]|uniref:response regulator transcription factor n=1 Tax=Nonomuraea sp. MG754425 TaxID=2570319 RepID=UPI001F01298D|nr:LuxR C-terminal-related transcriptional regulator [Nonomuraea sp. MG754425]MCF6473393.1 response regulator transcription factor [Nonomuraea sp. MG754425]